MHLSDVRGLFAYNEWANARMMDALAALDPAVFAEPRGGSFSSIRDTVAHIVSSEWVWLQRWNGESPSAPPEWSSLSEAGELAQKLREIESARAVLLGQLTESGMAKPLSYRNLKGEKFSQPLADQMVHVVNHSTYHRGQVATLCRQAGSAMPPTDLIVFRRENG